MDGPDPFLCGTGQLWRCLLAFDTSRVDLAHASLIRFLLLENKAERCILCIEVLFHEIASRSTRGFLYTHFHR